MAHSPSVPGGAGTPVPFEPFVPASQSVAEFTLKAVLVGSLFGIIFGASTVYLGLRAGLTVSASIPIAVLAISVLKRLGGSTILENNMVQTIGSAGESVAAGVVFTVPAFIFLLPRGPAFFSYFQITLLAFAGGILGVLMMIPLRRALIVKEHGVLPFPEGTACADVLMAGERGGSLARMVFVGLGVGALWKSLSWIFTVFLTEIGYSAPPTSQIPNATIGADVSPEYMGVGYVIGPRIAGEMVAGGVLSWLVLLPLISILGGYLSVPVPPFSVNAATNLPFLISEMSPGQLWSSYIRYIGAGAVLSAGLISLARTLPTIISSVRDSFKDLRSTTAASARLRTDSDLPMTLVLGGSLVLAVFMALTPGMPTQWNFLASLLMVVFGFLFVTVASRITGLIGSSSNPVSGMTIATLILTCLIFVSLGWTGDFYSPIALGVGAIVCIAAANGGATCQDLKSGHLVGATPRLQQIGELIGVVAAASVIGVTTLYMHRTFGIGSADLPAPQATLMSTIIRGLLSQDLPWGLILVGIFLSVTLELCGVRSLSFAVGSYLPIVTTAPIFCGGVVRWWVARQSGDGQEGILGPGTLFSSGLIAGGSLTGILYAILFGLEQAGGWGAGILPAAQLLGDAVPLLHDPGVVGQVATALLFFGLAVVVARAARKTLD